jgi:hypothetical protein
VARMDAENRLSGILVSVEDAGAEVALPIRTLLRDRGQNGGLWRMKSFSALSLP